MELKELLPGLDVVRVATSTEKGRGKSGPDNYLVEGLDRQGNVVCHKTYYSASDNAAVYRGYRISMYDDKTSDIFRNAGTVEYRVTNLINNTVIRDLSIDRTRSVVTIVDTPTKLSAPIVSEAVPARASASVRSTTAAPRKRSSTASAPSPATSAHAHVSEN